MAEFRFRLQSAPGQETVSHAHTGRAPEGCTDVELIIFCQVGTVNDVDDLPAVFLPVGADEAACDVLQLLRHHEFIRAEPVFQRVMDGIHVPVFQ
jgi:hypothetical protein